MTRKDRFWEKVDVLGNCWEWRASRNRGGYGEFKVSGRIVKAHRVAWELAVGPIPDGLCVLHHCDNPPCVNPAHLFLGTLGDNSRDGEAKGRTIIPRLLGPDNPGWRDRCSCGQAYVIHADGRRRCRACNRKKNDAYRARLKAAHVSA